MTVGTPSRRERKRQEKEAAKAAQDLDEAKFFLSGVGYEAEEISAAATAHGEAAREASEATDKLTHSVETGSEDEES